MRIHPFFYEHMAPNDIASLFNGKELCKHIENKHRTKKFKFKESSTLDNEQIC